MRPMTQEHFFTFLGSAHLTGKNATRIRGDDVFISILGEGASKDRVDWDI